MNKKKHKSIYFLTFVLILLTGVVFIQISLAYTKTVSKENELQILEEELSLEKEKKIQLKEDMYYIETDDFIIEKARQEFNLIQDGETLILQKNVD
jgi:cell division protein FtsB